MFAHNFLIEIANWIDMDSPSTTHILRRKNSSRVIEYANIALFWKVEKVMRHQTCHNLTCFGWKLLFMISPFASTGYITSPRRSFSWHISRFLFLLNVLLESGQKRLLFRIIVQSSKLKHEAQCHYDIIRRRDTEQIDWNYIEKIKWFTKTLFFDKVESCRLRP